MDNDTPALSCSVVIAVDGHHDEAISTEIMAMHGSTLLR